MDKIVVNGGNQLNGTVEISGMKNAALPIIYACVLVGAKCVIENVPNVRDVALSLEILRDMGAVVNCSRQLQSRACSEDQSILLPSRCRAWSL